MCSRTAFSRPRPEVFKAKAEASDICDENVWVAVAQKVWNPQANGSHNHGYLCVNTCVKLGNACNFMQTCEV